MNYLLPIFTTLAIARAQFALTTAFHIVFPSMTIGLLLFMVVLELMLLNYQSKFFRKAYNCLSKLFSITFTLGTISGILLSFQLGLNWAVFYRFAGIIINQLLAYEVLTAFFLEAGFLGIMLFGGKAVSRRAHFLSTVLVCGGAVASAFWIISTNSWMQTPKGFMIINSKAFPSSWMEVVFNPSFFLRFAHALIATIISSSALITSTLFWQLPVVCNNHQVSIMIPTILRLLAGLVSTQITLGDLHGLHSLKHQPKKISSLEAFWKREGVGVPINLACLTPSNKGRSIINLYIPRLGSLLFTHSLGGAIFSIRDFGRHCCPDVSPIFNSFRLMLAATAILVAFITTSLPHVPRACSNFLVPIYSLATSIGPAGYVALLSGWVTAEVGRQPWAVSGVIKTAQCVNNAPYAEVCFGFCNSVLLYSTLLCFGSFYLIRTRPYLSTIKL